MMMWEDPTPEQLAAWRQARPIDRPCDGCYAEAGEPCMWGCLSNVQARQAPRPRNEIPRNTRQRPSGSSRLSGATWPFQAVQRPAKRSALVEVCWWVGGIGGFWALIGLCAYLGLR